MVPQKKPYQFLYWIIIGIFVFLFIYLLVKLYPFYQAFFSFIWHLLLPFLIAGLIAYLLFPIVNKIHSYNIPKALAILIIYVIFFGGIGYLSYRVYPMVVNQLKDLNEFLPQFIEKFESLIYQVYESTAFLPETVHDKFDDFLNRMENRITTILESAIGGITKLLDMIIILTVIPVLVFYFLKDLEKIKAYLKQFIPKKYQEKSSELVHAIDKSLGNYIRGQLLVCLFVGITSYIIFYFLGLNYALILAIIIGLTNIIPYFGPIIGAIPAVGIALTVSGKMVLFVLIAIFVIQLIESNLLAPYIVGKSVAIHPIAIIFALLLGGQMSGVIGMILAVPILTILNVILNHSLILVRNR
ncbi:AI-2E family transporter [Ornithinibacillus halophilus]|uniref:Predicted PurR-regulated permease PerM n=1 Tax=Ornithinibacillus halophilus TaxID=930117 RepID=A0A1M5DJ49_9BACI|nr:AI-2E family transporter [Ornithinibacillus halophilus]SHF66762.1 Predicted PurR-regulated permease PerM [Ornithinibacillus halophilus]